MKKKIRAWLEEHTEEAMSWLAESVQKQSEQGMEKGVQLLVADRLDKIGLEVTVYVPEGEEFLKHPYF
jgi:acetylornithine deacetylase